MYANKKGRTKIYCRYSFFLFSQLYCFITYNECKGLQNRMQYILSFLHNVKEEKKKANSNTLFFFLWYYLFLFSQIELCNVMMFQCSKGLLEEVHFITSFFFSLFLCMHLSLLVCVFLYISLYFSISISFFSIITSLSRSPPFALSLALYLSLCLFSSYSLCIRMSI